MHTWKLRYSLFVLLTCLGATVWVVPSSAQKAAKGEQWWPSKWGADDQLGALNLLTPERVLAATKLITSGKIYDMTRVYEDSMPLFSLTPQNRKFTLVTAGGPTWGPMGRNKLVWNDDYVCGHLTQDGTQFDALVHMGTVYGFGDTAEVRYYNGHRHADIATAYGYKKLGIENVTPIFTRGVLIDIAGLKGRMLERSEEISIDDLKKGLARQSMSADDIRTADAVFYNTGWGRLWKVDNDKFNSGTPGLTPAAGDWLIEKEVLLVGTDNWAVEAIPSGNPDDPDLFAPNHQKFLVEHGIYIMENLDFTALIEAKVYEFAFVFGAAPIRGATGSAGRPFAIR